MKRLLIIIVFVAVIFSANKKIAITIDDLPIGYSQGLSSVDIENIFTNVLAILDSFDVKTIGFVKGQTADYYGKQPLKEFVERGHLIGNHTWSHPDLNNMPVSLYCEEIRICDEYLGDLQGDTKYFRYPMLHRGNSVEKRDGVYDCLKEMNYTIAPVSIDNDECIFNKNFTDSWAMGDIYSCDSIAQEYLIYMMKQTEYFDSLGYEITGRNIKHILLLHMNLLNSLFLDDLIEEYLKNDYEIITFKEALKDPIYSRKDNYTGNKGHSVLLRLK